MASKDEEMERGQVEPVSAHACVNVYPASHGGKDAAADLDASVEVASVDVVSVEVAEASGDPSGTFVDLGRESHECEAEVPVAGNETIKEETERSGRRGDTEDDHKHHEDHKDHKDKPRHRHARGEKLYDWYDGKKADVWSLGIILFAMITGSLPFSDPNVGALLEAVARGWFEIPQGVDGDIAAIIRAMTKVDPGERPSAKEVLAMLEGMSTSTPGAPGTIGAVGGVGAGGAALQHLDAVSVAAGLTRPSRAQTTPFRAQTTPSSTAEEKKAKQVDHRRRSAAAPLCVPRALDGSKSDISPVVKRSILDLESLDVEVAHQLFVSRVSHRGWEIFCTLLHRNAEMPKTGVPPGAMTASHSFGRPTGKARRRHSIQ